MKSISISPYAKNIKIEDRKEKGLFVFWNDPYDCFRIFENLSIAEKFASGEKIYFQEPKKGKLIPITERPKKSKQFEKWTERSTNEEFTTEVITGYHFGFSGKELAAVETCFYTEWPNQKTQVPPCCIIIEIPAGTKVTYYDDEIRVILNNNMKVWKLKSGFLKSE